jgi:predicted MFS family arabinose efflux permease
MNELSSIKEKKPSKKHFITSLGLAFFATGNLDILVIVFMVDIAATFLGSTDVIAVSIASQILMISSVVALVFGLFNSILSARYNHKSLLLLGVFFIILSTIGCFLAPEFIFLQFFFPLDGAGTVIVGAMAIAIIGELLPLEKRSKAIGWVIAGGLSASAIGAAMAGILESIWGWRSYLVVYVLPVSIVAFILVFFSVPKKVPFKKLQVLPSYQSSFRQVLYNKSAIACLFGNTFINSAGVWFSFASSFMRQEFNVSVQVVSFLVLGVILTYALGSVIGGYLVDTFGRKRFVVFSYFFRGLLIAATVLMPTFLGVVIMSFLAMFVGGFGITASRSLSLEQAPKSRGTMMSMNEAFWSLGRVIGTVMGGLILGQYGYQILGISLGTFGVIASLIISFFAKDSCIR